MADQEHFQEDQVDDSKFKLPDVEFATEAPKSTEDEEEVLYKTRARLLRFDTSVHTGEKEWKQRGTGVVKILKHKEMGKCRLLMRQDKTLKVCANHIIAPEIEMGEHPSTDKAWVFTAEDFADEEVKHETFCIMFRNAEIADEFKSNHDAARATNGGADGGNMAAAAGAPEEEAKGDEEPVEGDEVPFCNALEQIYSAVDLEAATARYAAITEAFQTTFDTAPSFFVRAPGRVNLIGEHIDYHGYNVMPMAIAGDIVVAVAVVDAEDTISVANFDAKYGAAEISANPEAEVDHADGVQWYHYVQCGYKAAYLKRSDKSHVGMKVMISGTVPASAGLSSSSALVVASTLATCVANRIQLSKTQVAKAAIEAERFVGTMSGGMDQTISCLAQAGSASEIQFSPLKATPVSLPEGVAFVVAHSLKDSPKAVRPWEGYNARVTEGKLAAKLVAKRAGVADVTTIQTVKDLQAALGLSSPNDLLPLVEEHLPAGAFDKAALAEAFGTEDLVALFAGDKKQAGAAQVLEHVASYELQRRLRHVASEAGRVERFVAMCNSGSSVNELGALLDASHKSCDEDYACSADELNELVAVAKSSGAIGARLTGAGWGGCMVAMVAAEEVSAFIAALSEKFYSGKVESEEISSRVFATLPGSGIAAYLPQ